MMKKLFPFNLAGFVLFVQLISCSNTSSIPNAAPVASEANSIPQVGMLPDTEPLINSGGWVSPGSSSLLTTIQNKNANWRLDDGKVQKVIIKTYRPESIITFAYAESAESNSSFRPYDRLTLISIGSVSVGANAFAKIIWAKKEVNQSEVSTDQHPQHPFVYQIFDNDGDGTFESLYLSAANSTVPRWAVSR